MRRLDTLSPGYRAGEHWVILDQVGEGATAAVYRVRHAQLGLVAALKVVAVPSRSVMERLRAEGLALSRVQHRNIVGVRDVLDVDGAPGLLMDWVAGPALDRLIEEVALELPQIDALARGILHGVAAAHEGGLVHRDLKPGNILVSVEPDALVPKVADFGIAKDLVGGASATRTGAVLGTPRYMSPEQIRDPRSVDQRSDLFSLGTILYELVSREPAYGGEDVLDIFRRIAEGGRRPILELRPDLPPRMARAIEWALAIERDARPPDVAALLGCWSGDVSDLELAGAFADPALLERVRGMITAVPATPLEVATVGWTTVPDPPDSTAVVVGRQAARSALAIAGLGISCGGALGMVGIASLVMSTWTTPVEPPAPRPTPVPVAPAPEPIAAPPPVPVEPPSPEPPRSKVVRNLPQPIATVPPPGPALVPTIPEVPPVAPVAPVAPELPPVGSIRVRNAVSWRLLDGDRVVATTDGSVPPGTYRMEAVFDPGKPPVRVLSNIRVEGGKTVVVDCGIGHCQVKSAE